MDQYGSDFISITADDGTEFELEVLSATEYNGCTYFTVILAEENQDVLRTEVSILKSVEEDGEPVLYAVEDPDELETVYGLVMDSLYEEEDE